VNRHSNSDEEKEATRTATAALIVEPDWEAEPPVLLAERLLGETGVGMTQA
jgi:hypothetical protein